MTSTEPSTMTKHWEKEFMRIYGMVAFDLKMPVEFFNMCKEVFHNGYQIGLKDKPKKKQLV